MKGLRYGFADRSKCRRAKQRRREQPLCQNEIMERVGLEACALRAFQLIAQLAESRVA